MNTNQTAAAGSKSIPMPDDRTNKKIMKQESIAYEKLRREALSALNEYRRCRNNFDFIADDKLVDVSIYDIQKALSRYEYLICELKRIKL